MAISFSKLTDSQKDLLIYLALVLEHTLMSALVGNHRQGGFVFVWNVWRE